MILRLDSGRWYIDVRGPGSSEQLSLDLTQHLPRRLAAGKIVVVTDRPKVFLSVVRKRWMKLLYEAGMQCSSTLNPLRRQGLLHEIGQMETCHFSARPVKLAPAGTCVFFINPGQVDTELPPYATLYIVTPLTSRQVLAVMRQLRPGGLIVIYGDWTIEYEIILQQAFK